MVDGEIDDITSQQVSDIVLLLKDNETTTPSREDLRDVVG